MDPRSTARKQHGQRVSLPELREMLARKIAAIAKAEGDTLTTLPGLKLYRRSAPTACASAAYQPTLVVFAQGQKRVNLGKHPYLCEIGRAHV